MVGTGGSGVCRVCCISCKRSYSGPRSMLDGSRVGREGAILGQEFSCCGRGPRSMLEGSRVGNGGTILTDDRLGVFGGPRSTVDGLIDGGEGTRLIVGTVFVSLILDGFVVGWTGGILSGSRNADSMSVMSMEKSDWKESWVSSIILIDC